ncbi:MAG: hypothetical protein ABJD07_07960 [Gemmatimonadaceae bacterium]
MTPHSPRRRATLVALGSLSMAACADRRPRVSPATTVRVFIVMDGADTIRTERFTRGDTAIAGTIAYSRVRSPASARVPGLPLGDTIEYHASLRDDGSVRHVRVRLAEPSAHGVAPTMRETDLPADASLLIPGSIGSLEQALLRARRMHVASATFSAWTGDPSAPARVTIQFDAAHADSASLQFGDRWRLAIDSAGQVLWARIAGGTVRVTVSRPRF